MRNNEERTGAVQHPDSPAPSQTQTGQNGLNFVAPTEFVEIPSKGKFYPQGHPLQGVESVEIRQMTAKEEDILSSQTLLKQGVAIDRFLQSVIVDKKLNSDSMLIGDKNALIVAARCSGYGIDYGTTITCPNCTANNSLNIDLGEAKQPYGGYNATEAEEPLEGVEGPDAVGNYFITLPVSKARFEVKLMTGREEKAFAKRLETRRKKRQAEAMMTDQFKTFTLSINGIGSIHMLYMLSRKI